MISSSLHSKWMLLFALLVLHAVHADTLRQPNHHDAGRILEDEQGEDQDSSSSSSSSSSNSLALVETILGSGEDIANYHLRLSTCTAVNIMDQNTYTTSQQHFLHFHSCLNSNGGYLTQFWDTFTCPHVSHVVRMDDYFQSTTGCVQDYCDECNTACDDDGYCNSKCIEQCGIYSNVTAGSMDYGGCSGPYVSGGGRTYYAGPSCDDDGGVTMGRFSDEDCEVSTTLFEEVYLFNMFDFVDSVCSVCSDGSVCENLYNASTHCDDDTMTAVAVGESTSMYSEDDQDEEGESQMEFANEVCYETATEKQKEHVDGSKTPLWFRRTRYHIVSGMLAMAAVGLAWCIFIFIAYYVRYSSTLGGAEESLCDESYLEDEISAAPSKDVTSRVSASIRAKPESQRRTHNGEYA